MRTVFSRGMVNQYWRIAAGSPFCNSIGRSIDLFCGCEEALHDDAFCCPITLMDKNIGRGIDLLR